jgi:hypothetical protein
MLVSWAEMPRSPGHVFYDKLQAMLIATSTRSLRCNARRNSAASRPPVVAAGPVLPHAADRLFRRHRQRAWPGMQFFSKSLTEAIWVAQAPTA